MDTSKYKYDEERQGLDDSFRMVRSFRVVRFGERYFNLKIWMTKSAQLPLHGRVRLTWNLKGD